MENLELLEQMAANQKMQAQTILNLTMVLDNVCRRVVNIEHCMARADGIVKQNVNDIEELMGNTVLPKNKTRGRVIPFSIVAREIAGDDV